MQTGAVSSTASYPRKVAAQKSSGHSKVGPALRSQGNNAPTMQRPAQGSAGGYDAKLVDMINSVIVDHSPSVKWEDIG